MGLIREVWLFFSGGETLWRLGEGKELIGGGGMKFSPIDMCWISRLEKGTST
jgi:hypothetical protein